MAWSVSRRRFITSSVSGLALFGGNSIAGEQGKPCEGTVRRGEGPFYPTEPIPSAADLTSQPGTQGRAVGEVLYVFGKVSDTACNPVSGARVEIWQADDKGRYKHARASSQSVLDDNFGYFSAVDAAADGSYMFKTIVPANYSFGSLNRAPHIHYKIKAEGFRNLTTELYFEDDRRLQAQDPVFLGIPEGKRASLIVAKQDPAAFADQKVAIEPGAICCRFDVVLQSRNNPEFN